MKLQKKHLSAAVALVLILSFAVTLTTIAPVAAQKTKPVMVLYEEPNPVGIGQRIYIVGLIAPPSPVANYIFYNLTFTITKPDGTKDVRTVESDPAATYSFDFVCDQTGTWTCRLDWTGDIERKPAGPASVAHPGYEPGSATTTWIVQQEPVTLPFTDANPVPLPTGPWAYPISGENREWYQISGDWPTPSSKDGTTGTRVNLYSKAPNTAHILWRTPMSSGGQLVGGEEGWLGVKPGWPTTDIVSALGRLYYPIRAGTGSTLHPILVCQDIQTGEIIWESDLGYNPTYACFPRLAGLEFTSSTKLDYKDPVTQQYVTLPSAASVWLVGTKAIWEVDMTTGALLNYLTPSWLSQYTTVSNNNMFMSQGSGQVGSVGSSIYLCPFRPVQDPGKELLAANLTRFDCRTRTVKWTRDISKLDLAAEQIYNNTGLIGYGIDEKNGIVVLCMDSRGGWPTVYKVISWNSTTGALINIGPNLIYSSTSGKTILIDNGMSFYHASDNKYHAVSIFTGQIVWSSESCQLPWGIQGTYGGITAAYGYVYGGTHDGYIYCFDENTGKTVWKYFCGNTTETAFGHLAPFGSRFVADGKVYFITGEHTPPNPPPRGNKLFCLDAYTGELLWSYPMMVHNMVGMGSGIASGNLWAPNQYDGYLYVFGKGPSAATVSVGPKTIANGDSVLIEGTVTDQSSGAKDTPAISDESMTPWMEYLYSQWPMPTNATGVPVHLMAMRSDGSIIDITHVTSDIMGHYEFTWTPPAEDTYKVLATFEGSESYWASSAQTALGVTTAPPAPLAAPEAAPDNTSYIIGTGIAIIIAVAIATILILRKRP